SRSVSPSSRRTEALCLLEQSSVVHVERGLCAVGELQLAEDVGDVGLHGALADAELGADLLVRATRGDELQDLALARREVGVALVLVRLRAAHAQPAELVEYAPRDARVDERETVGDGADRVRELLRAHLLE